MTQSINIAHANRWVHVARGFGFDSQSAQVSRPSLTKSVSFDAACIICAIDYREGKEPVVSAGMWRNLLVCTRVRSRHILLIHILLLHSLSYFLCQFPVLPVLRPILRPVLRPVLRPSGDLQAHYRSRVERIIRRIKSHAWCEGRTFRGSYALLVQCLNTTAITTALGIRHEFLIGRKPQFEVVGPWPHAFQ